MAISKIPSSGISDAVNFKNLIINGDMSISQRGTSFATMGNGDTQYTLDRFQWNEEGSFGDAELTITQDTDVPTGQGFAKSLKAVCTTVDTSIDTNTISYITHKFEGQNLQHLNRGRSTAKSLTLSFWAKSNLTGTFTVAFKDVDNSRLYSASYSPSVADTWEKFIITIPGDTSGGLSNDNGHSFSVDWNLQAGTSKSNGALTTAWEAQAEGDRAVGQTNFFSSTSNNFYLTGVQLEIGTSASEFEFLPHDVNKIRCQRYCERIDKSSTETIICIGAGVSSSSIFGRVYFAIEKRVVPSATISDAGHLQGLTSNAGAWHTASGASVGSGDERQMRLTLTGLSSMTTGGCHEIRINDANGFVIWDAEL